MIKILAVDDDLDFHEILKVKLPAKDYELTLTTTEVEFYEKFNSIKFDILLLDLSLDNNPLKGLEILAKIRQEKEGGNVPVIVLTNTSNKKTVSSALELGANDFINKPVDGSMLTTKIKELVSGTQAFAKELEFGDSPGQQSKVVLSTKLRLVALTEIGFLVEGNTYVAKGSKIKLKSDRIKEIFGTEMIEVYSTGFNSEISGIYLTAFEIDPDQKETINKAKMWVKANKE